MSEKPLPSPKEIGVEKTSKEGRRSALKKLGAFLATATGVLAFGSKTAEAKPLQTPPPPDHHPMASKPPETDDSSIKPTSTEEHISAESAKEKESFKGELSFGLVKGFTDGGNGNERIIIDRIKDLLANHQVSAVMTAEYAFFPPGHENGFIELQEKDGKYFPTSISTPEYAQYLNELQDLAKQHKTDIFAATFKERTIENLPIDPFGKPVYNDTMFHIDKNGEIVGIARKGLVTKGDWTIEQNGQKFNTLPIICQDIATETYPGGKPGYPKSKVPKSITDEYDALLHPQRLRDVPVEALTDMYQGNDSEAAKDYAVHKDHLEFMVNNSYSDYSKVLKTGAPIVTTDVGMAGAFTTDGKPFNEYQNKKDYSVIKIKR